MLGEERNWKLRWSSEKKVMEGVKEEEEEEEEEEEIEREGERCCGWGRKTGK